MSTINFSRNRELTSWIDEETQKLYVCRFGDALEVYKKLPLHERINLKGQSSSEYLFDNVSTCAFLSIGFLGAIEQAAARHFS